MQYSSTDLHGPYASSSLPRTSIDAPPGGSKRNIDDVAPPLSRPAHFKHPYYATPTATLYDDVSAYECAPRDMAYGDAAAALAGDAGHLMGAPSGRAISSPPPPPPSHYNNHSSTSPIASDHHASGARGGAQKARRKPGRKPISDSHTTTPAPAAAHPIEDGGDDVDVATKRKVQNRAAQRAFRVRKEKYVHELEDRVKALEEHIQQTGGDVSSVPANSFLASDAPSTALEKQNHELRLALEQLRQENEVLRSARSAAADYLSPSALAVAPASQQWVVPTAIDATHHESLSETNTLAGSTPLTFADFLNSMTNTPIASAVASVPSENASLAKGWLVSSPVAQVEPYLPATDWLKAYRDPSAALPFLFGDDGYPDMAEVYDNGAMPLTEIDPWPPALPSPYPSDAAVLAEPETLQSRQPSSYSDCTIVHPADAPATSADGYAHPLVDMVPQLGRLTSVELDDLCDKLRVNCRMAIDDAKAKGATEDDVVSLIQTKVRNKYNEQQIRQWTRQGW